MNWIKSPIKNGIIPYFVNGEYNKELINKSPKINKNHKMLKIKTGVLGTF